MTQRICSVTGCDNPARTNSAEWCPMHYHRWYRHGDVSKTAADTPLTASNGRRYRATHQPSHPLAPPSGRVYVHRTVLYDAIGPGPHRCNWCGTEVDWLPKGDPRALLPDHVNGIGDDNRIDNLVPSCQPCNTTRGAQQRSDLLREAGWWSAHDTIERLRSAGRRPRIAS